MLSICLVFSNNHWIKMRFRCPDGDFLYLKKKQKLLTVRFKSGNTKNMLVVAYQIFFFCYLSETICFLCLKRKVLTHLDLLSIPQSFFVIACTHRRRCGTSTMGTRPWYLRTGNRSTGRMLIKAGRRSFHWKDRTQLFLAVPCI